MIVCVTGRWTLPTQPIFDFDAELAPESDFERAEREFAERRRAQAARERAEREKREKAERDRQRREKFEQDRRTGSFTPESPYDVLGVPYSATQAEIRAAWVRLVKIYTTDPGSANGSNTGDTAKMQKINAAYKSLKGKG